MHSTTAALAPHGPEYYQAFLAQQEDEIPKPKRTPRVLRSIHRMRQLWKRYIPTPCRMSLQANHARRFCREILGPTVEPVDRLRVVSLRDLQVFLRWHLAARNMRKLRTVLNAVKDWNMMYRDDVGHSLENELVSQINTVR